MKKMLLIAVSLVSFQAAHASELCGVLTKSAEGPSCPAGQACPQFVRLVYRINGTEIQTGNMTVLSKLEGFVNDYVCAEGRTEATGFSVSSVELNDQ